jgi:hypothetical protein
VQMRTSGNVCLLAISGINLWETGRIPRLLHSLDGPEPRDFNLVDLKVSIR